MNNEKNKDISTADLEEGLLYRFTKGVLKEIEIDPDDAMRKIKITDDAFAALIELQKAMRKSMLGYRPDISIIGTALILHAARSSDAKQIVKDCALELYQSFDFDNEGGNQ